MNDRFQRMSDDGMVLFHADCAGAIYWAYVGSSASSGPFRTFNAALKNYNADTEVAHRKLGDDWSDWSDTSEEGNGQVSELPARLDLVSVRSWPVPGVGSPADHCLCTRLPRSRAAKRGGGGVRVTPLPLPVGGGNDGYLQPQEVSL